MKIRVGTIERVGQALDLRSLELGADRLVVAVRDPAETIVVSPNPKPVHEMVGHIRPGMHFDCGGALAAAGRSIGLESPQAAAISRLDRQIAAIDPEPVDLHAARRRAAEAGADVSALQEQVARTSGRLEARRSADLPRDAVEERLAALTRKLTEAETEAIAAQETLARAEATAEAARDAREKRLRLVDRRENRRREARQWFRTVVGGQFERALRALPTTADPNRPVDFDGPSHEAALAIARVADLSAPVVLVDSIFETAIEARAALDAPVILARV